MNIIEVQESLKDLPDNALMQEMQNPTGSAPQFLVLSELKRRKRMRDDYQRRQAGDIQTVAEEAVTAAGAPQEGIMQVSRAMNPESSIAQNTGMDTAAQMPPTQAPQPEQPMMMADGGLIKMQEGGFPSTSVLAAAIARGTPREQLIEIFGIDAVREAESTILPSSAGLSLGDSRLSRRETRRMEDQGIFGNSPGRNIGGEGIASVATSVEDFMVQPYERGTGRATMVDGTFVEVMPDGSVFDARTGEMVTGDLAQAAIAKLSPDLTGDTAAFTEFAGTPSMYRPEAGMPTQEDLDLKAVSDARNSAFGIGESDVRPTLPSLGGEAPAAIGGINSFDVRVPAVPFLDDVVSPDNLSAIGGLETIQSAPEAFTMDTAAANLASMVGPDDAIEQVRASQVTSGVGSQLDPVAQAREDEINSLLAVFNDPNRTEAEVKAARQRLEQIGAKDRIISNVSETLEGFGQAVTDRIASDAADIYGTLGTGANLLGSTDTATALFEAQKEAEAKVTPPEIEAEAVVSNIPEDISLNLPDTAAAESDTESTPTLSSVLSGLDDQSLSVGDLLPKDTDTSTAPAGRKSTSTSGGTGGGVGGRIAQMLADREKSAEADKWMALAQAGMALMASDQPTFGGALGEAGLVGVGAMQKARKQYDADILDLLTLQQRANAASSRKSGGLTASNMISLVRNLQSYKGDIQDRIDDLNDLSKIGTMSDEERAAQLQRLQAEIMRTDFQIGTYMNALSGGGTGGSSFDVRGGSTQQPSVGYSLGTATQ